MRSALSTAHQPGGVRPDGVRRSAYGAEFLIGLLVAAAALKEAARRAHPLVAHARAVSRVDSIIAIAVLAETLRRVGAAGR